MTPGRRLEPTLEKLERCMESEVRPLRSSARALIALVLRKSNRCLEDFAVEIGASRDDENKFRTNVDLLLKLLTAELANSGEWKLIEMANRHEVKYIFDTTQSCGHRFTNRRVANQDSDTIEFTVPLASANLTITETELQREINRYNSHTSQVECGTCKKTVDLVRFMHVPYGCDPDFLTLVCKPPVNIEARKLKLQFSRSSYEVKAVSHWQMESKMGAVSCEKSDRSWWSHALVEGQPADFQYTETELEGGVHFQDAAVLFAVRLDPNEDDDGDEMAEEEGDAREDFEEMEIADQHLDSLLRNASEAGDGNEMTMTNSSIEIQIQTGGNDDDGEVQDESDDEATKAMIEQAKVRSRKVNWKCLDQQQIIDRGMNASIGLGLACYAHERSIPMDGRCLWSGIARSRNPSLSGVELAREADELRTRAVGATMEWMDALSSSDLEVVQAIVAVPKKEPMNREEMIDELAKYMRGTTYAGKMGDLLFQAASAFLHQSLIIIELRNEGDYCLPVSPDSGLFNCHEEIAYPAILVRQGDHYEELGLPEESRKEAVALLQDFKTNNRGVTLRIKGQRITPIATSTPMENNDNDSPGESQGDHQTQVLCALFVCLFVLIIG